MRASFILLSLLPFALASPLSTPFSMQKRVGMRTCASCFTACEIDPASAHMAKLGIQSLNNRAQTDILCKESCRDDNGELCAPSTSPIKRQGPSDRGNGPDGNDHDDDARNTQQGGMASNGAPLPVDGSCVDRNGDGYCQSSTAGTAATAAPAGSNSTCVDRDGDGQCQTQMQGHDDGPRFQCIDADRNGQCDSSTTNGTAPGSVSGGTGATNPAGTAGNTTAGGAGTTAGTAGTTGSAGTSGTTGTTSTSTTSQNTLADGAVSLHSARFGAALLVLSGVALLL